MLFGGEVEPSGAQKGLGCSAVDLRKFDRAMIGKGYAPGTFIVHHCLPEDAERKAYYFHSNRVDFGKALA